MKKGDTPALHVKRLGRFLKPIEKPSPDSCYELLWEVGEADKRTFAYAIECINRVNALDAKAAS